MNHLVLQSYRSCYLLGARVLARRNQGFFKQQQQPQQTQRSLATTTIRLSANESNNSNDHDFRHSEELAKERYDIRAGEDVDRKRARLLYQSRKRGMLENGVILASFADKYLHVFDEKQLDEYDRLINLPTNDWDIFYWATKTKPTPAEFETNVMAKLREHLRSKVSKEDEAEDASRCNSDNSSDKTNEAQKDQDEFWDAKFRREQKSKEDDEGSRLSKDSVLGKSRPDDIVLPASKKKYELEIDPVEEDLTNFRENLFDYRVKWFKSGSGIQNMTDWRKKKLEARLRRGLSQPVSLRNMNEHKEAKVYSQRAPRRSIAAMKPYSRNTDLLDSTNERKIKHHNFMQYLLRSEFTHDIRDYEDEAEAWAEMYWRRDYGSSDLKLAPSFIKCNGCNANLHCCDPGHDGYIPKELFIRITTPDFLTSKGQAATKDRICQKCKFLKTYDVNLSAEVTKHAYEDILKDIGGKPPSIVLLLVDLTDFPGGLWPNLLKYIGTHHKLIVIGNKLDLLPIDGPNFFERVKESLKQNMYPITRGDTDNLQIFDTMLLSARTGLGVQNLVTRVANLLEVNGQSDVYLMGSSNSGKSTLFNAMLQSDLSALRKSDLISRVSPYELSSSSKKFLKFPIAQLEGWEVETAKRRMHAVERDTAKLERSLETMTALRRNSMPHMSLLSNKLEYLAVQHDQICDSKGETKLVNQTQNISTSLSNQVGTYDEEPELRFADDHPMAKYQPGQPLSANGEEFADHAYFHYTPSAKTENQLENLLTRGEKFDVFIHETLVPRKFILRPMQTIFISGLARLDLLTASSVVEFNVLASKNLPVHVIPTRKADHFYQTFLGSPYLGVPNAGGAIGDVSTSEEEKDESMIDRLKKWPKMKPASRGDVFVKGIHRNQGGVLDIVYSSVGWILVQLIQDQEALIRPYSPGGRGIYVRSPPLLAHVNSRSTGRKVRDTPVFEHPHYKLDQMPA